VRRYTAAIERRDFDTALRFWGPDPVWDMSPTRVGVLEGPAAIRGLLQDSIGSYEEWAMGLEEFRDFGNGVTLAVFIQKGRLVGNSGEVSLRVVATGRASGAPIELASTQVVTIRNGRMTSSRVYRDRSEALKAVGLAG